MSGPWVGKFQALMDRIGTYFIRGPNVGKFLQSFAMVLDQSATELDLGLSQTQPLKCDVSQLPTLSIDRTIRLYAGEPATASRQRLAAWLPAHRPRGTQLGELLHSRPYFLPDTPIMRIVHQAGDGSSATWHTLEADGTYSIHVQTPSNWPYDALTARWWRFWVILYVPAGMLHADLYDDGGVYDGLGIDGLPETYLGTTPAGAARDLVDMMLEWERFGEYMQAYILAEDPASFDPTAAASSPGPGTDTPDGFWGSHMVGGVCHRLETAHWIYERADAGAP